MLRALSIRDMLLIDRLDLEFQPGLNVLTGETGAGKSILLDSLGFVLGWRGRADLVRAGAKQAEAEAVFELAPDHLAFGVLEEAGIPSDGEVILRRTNAPDGRKQAWVNDRRCSGEVLRRLSECLVELHGQHDDRGLLDARGHRALLDAFGGLGGKATELREAWRAVGSARKVLNAAAEILARARSEEDYLRHSAAELEALDPQPGEEEALDSRRRLMQSAERIRADVSSAAQALGGQGAEGLLVDAQRWLETAESAAEGALTEPLAALGRALAELGEAQSGVEAALGQLEFDPLELEATEERLFALRGLARKHQVLPEALPELASDFRARLTALDAGEDDIADLQKALDAALAAYDRQADVLSKARARAAAQLDKAMGRELPPLKLERAVFRTVIDPAEPGPDGVDAVRFTVATNPGAPAGALDKIASGGELRRFLLALKVCLAGDSPGITMIFDEIDRGVGGATADAVGRRLAGLAERAQVLVVTHSPQVAARGGHHWQVAKETDGKTTLSRVRSLDDGARVEEIARMLAGDRVTDAAREAARSLIGAS